MPISPPAPSTMVPLSTVTKAIVRAVIDASVGDYELVIDPEHRIRHERASDRRENATDWRLDQNLGTTHTQVV